MKKYSIEQTNYIVRGMKKGDIKPGHYRKCAPEFETQATFDTLEEAINELEKNTIDFSVSESKDALGDRLDVTEAVITAYEYDGNELVDVIAEYTLGEAKDKA